MKKIRKFLIILPLLLLSCESNSVNGSNASINSANKTATLTVTVKDGSNQNPIANAEAKIILSDGIPSTIKTNNNGVAIFTGLVEGNSYNVEVSANDYIKNSASTASSNIAIKSNTNSSINISMYKSLGSFSGRVLSTSGQAIDNAVIKVGNDLTLSDAEGKFRVNISSLTSQNISISKTGYSVLNYGNSDFNINEKDKNGGDLKLSKTNNQLSVVFDTSKKPFGTDGLGMLSGLSQNLVTLGYKVSFEDFLNKQNTDQIDTLVIACPSNDYSESDIEKIVNFTKQGKKLIIIGEWGGYSYFNSFSINKLIRRANLKINPDIIKETDKLNILGNDEQIISNNIIPHFITKEISKLSFYSSASVEVINGGSKSIDNNTTKLLAFNSSKGFRIQVYNQGQFAFIGSSLIDLGKVIVVADSSIFSLDDSDDNGKSNIDKNDNKKIIKNIIEW